MFGGLVKHVARWSGRSPSTAEVIGGRALLAPPIIVETIAQDRGDMMPAGVWPADPDAAPDWVLRQLARARAAGRDVPQIRTRAEFDAAVARCAARLAAPAQTVAVDPPAPVSVPPLREFTGAEAAQLFLAHLRATVSAPKRFTSDEFSAAYHAWCDLEPGRPPVPENVLRGEIKSLDGIARTQIDIRVEGRRVRPFVWTVSPETNPKLSPVSGATKVERVAA